MASGQKVQRSRNQSSKIKKCCGYFLAFLIISISFFSFIVCLQMINNYQKLTIDIEKTKTIFNESNLNDSVAKILIQEIETLKAEVETLKKGYVKLGQLSKELSINSTSNSWNIGDIAEASKDKIVRLTDRIGEKMKVINEKYKIKDKAGVIKENVVEGGKKMFEKSKNLTKSVINKIGSFFNYQL